MDTVEHHSENFLVNQFGDRYLYRVNRNAFNAIGSDTLYRSLFGERLFEEFQLNIIVGTDSGLLPKYLAKHGVTPGSRYVFVELPDILEVLAQEPELEELPAEITLTTLEEFLAQTDKYQLESYALLDAVCINESVGTRDGNLIEYRDLAWELTLALQSKVHQIIVTANIFPFTLRQMENIPDNQIAFSDTLVGAFPGQTAIILAGGPSLNEALPWVKENRDRIVIVAVSRICRTLLAEGIVPHIVVSVDPTVLSFEISREMLAFADAPNPPLFISNFHAAPLLVGQWPGSHAYTGSLFPWPSPLNTDHLKYNGPTVSNFALSISAHLGCTSIILAGVNLCYSAEGQTHAAGSNEAKVGPDLGQMTTPVETYGGSFAATNNGFSSAIRTLAAQAREFTARGIRIYNCSLGAAKVSQIEHLALDQVQLPSSALLPSQVISERLPKSTRESRRIHYRRVKKEIQDAQKKLHGILSLCRDALHCADGLFGRNGVRQDFRHKVKMDKIERRLDRRYGDLSGQVKLCGLKKFLISLRTTMAEDEMSDEQVEQATREYYEVYQEGTNHLLGILEAVLQRIEARIEEDKVSGDFEKIVAQWEKDQQFGRASVWRKRNPEAERHLDEAGRAALERVDERFTQVMTEERTTHVMRTEDHHSLARTRSKAQLLFKRGESHELEVMATGLAGHPDPDKALPYLNFVKGLLAELNGEAAEAVDYYQQLFTDPPHQLTEDALLQVVHLSLAEKDPDNALLALECLIGFSPTYLTVYAELLKAVGRFEDAFNALRHYISLIPDDVGALTSLGLMCREAGIVEAAIELFQRVLEKDPRNGAAQKLLAELEGAGAALVCQG